MHPFISFFFFFFLLLGTVYYYVGRPLIEPPFTSLSLLFTDSQTSDPVERFSLSIYFHSANTIMVMRIAFSLILF